MKSTFSKDLNSEQKLAKFLDDNYYNDKNKFSDLYLINRVDDLDMQHKGVDLEITNTETGIKFYIDEKAQSHYVNKSLPTFAFELSYLKNNSLREGWLFDNNKITQQYFIITCIQEVQNKIKSCRLISVDRDRLIALLIEKNLTQHNLSQYENEYRANNDYGKHLIREFGDKEGFLFYTEHLAEKPINVVFYLDYLIKQEIGTELFPCQL